MKHIGGKYNVLLANEGKKTFEFAVITGGSVIALFTATPSQYSDMIMQNLKEAVRAAYSFHGKKPTWEEVDAFAEEVLESIEIEELE